ncbi:MAG: DUF2461 domain-containing protein [Ferruginibacter sp.]|nr:DUF2461 domain-containing protein [Ferruginibacter sp.]
MISKSSLQYLDELRKNNHKNWFEENRGKYETARTDFSAFVEAIIRKTAKFDEPIGHLTTKDCIFRINRDVRFSKDKTPYKVNMAAAFSAGGKKAPVAGYYFHLEPGKSFAGGGFYTPAPDQLSKIRQEIDYNFSDWEKIIHQKTFQRHFSSGIEGNGSLVRPPKGYEESNPAINFLKMKGFIVTQYFSDDQLLQTKAAQDVADSFKAMKPLIEFLNQAIE